MAAPLRKNEKKRMNFEPNKILQRWNHPLFVRFKTVDQLSYFVIHWLKRMHIMCLTGFFLYRTMRITSCTFQQHSKTQNHQKFHFTLDTCSLNTTNKTKFLACVCAQIYTLTPVLKHNNKTQMLRIIKKTKKSRYLNEWIKMYTNDDFRF